MSLFIWGTSLEQSDSQTEIGRVVARGWGQSTGNKPSIDTVLDEQVLVERWWWPWCNCVSVLDVTERFKNSSNCGLYVCFTVVKIWKRNQRDNMVWRMLALCAVNPGLIPDAAYSSWAQSQGYALSTAGCGPKSSPSQKKSGAKSVTLWILLSRKHKKINVYLKKYFGAREIAQRAGVAYFACHSRSSVHHMVLIELCWE